MIRRRDEFGRPALCCLAARLERLGKNVSLVTVATGNHYDSMIQHGVPRRIEWMKGLELAKEGQR